MAFHLRSVSLPSKRISNEAEVEAELQSLEEASTSSSSPSATIESACDGLRRLGDVYSHIEEIIHLPSNQVCSIQQRKELDDETESSLEVIDLCNAMQESFAEMKTTIQDLLVVLRRGGDDSNSQAKVLSYIRCLVKKAQKQSKKIIKKTTTSDECKLVRLLLKARSVAASLLELALRLVAKQVVMMPKRSLVSKALFHKRSVVVCKEEQLQALDCIVGDLEHGAEQLFRRMIQSRVAILNILSS